MCGFKEEHALQNFNPVKFKMADAIIDTNMPNIWKTMPDIRTVTKNKMCYFTEGYALQNFNLIKFKIANLRP